MKLSAAAILSMAVLPALADSAENDYVLVCSRDSYRGSDAQSHFEDFYKRTCSDSGCEKMETPDVGDSVVLGGCIDCPSNQDLNGVPNCLLAPKP
ncbi:hypothetical protein E4U09_005252 [Claviceps aff. purpurea]|uniref:Uncharacterized protein n=1 Tax=Claviceps aff. purpurea TaxID=1967640 RepID=A0A9P7QC43_9HYPO|nr:hypothetical protein E4U09_005252 [Claviceps aff. purpurea]